jgi:hypothetical protein
MGKSKHSQESAGQPSKTSVKVSTKIVSQPSEEDLIPTEREKRLLQELFEWQERSRKIHCVLGLPLGVNT